MKAWPEPATSRLPMKGPTVEIWDTATEARRALAGGGPSRIYVCGITPYDATHIGHAATYIGFDLLVRALRNAGHDVIYTQNVTDVDDPLLKRAATFGVDWEDLAEFEVARFRRDMTALRVLPPTHYIGVVEAIGQVIGLIERLQAAGSVYAVGGDLYFDVNTDPFFGQVSHLPQDAMVELFSERGGDPERSGKRHPLDCLVWRGERPGEPSWPSPWGSGRPGWHVGCAAIARQHLGSAFEVQGGGRDLIFPHHEMTAGIAQVADPEYRFAQTYVHAGMVAHDGMKMSKSEGNLIFVSALRDQGVDPMALRLVLLRHHYRSNWEWADSELSAASATLAQWRAALGVGAGAPAAPVASAVLKALADDLDTATALKAVQDWVDATLGSQDAAHASDPAAAHSIRAVLDAALGLAL